jgi:translation elongation factor EF-1beta
MKNPLRNIDLDKKTVGFGILAIVIIVVVVFYDWFKNLFTSQADKDAKKKKDSLNHIDVNTQNLGKGTAFYDSLSSEIYDVLNGNYYWSWFLQSRLDDFLALLAGLNSDEIKQVAINFGVKAFTVAGFDTTDPMTLQEWLPFRWSSSDDIARLKAALINTDLI